MLASSAFCVYSVVCIPILQLCEERERRACFSIVGSDSAAPKTSPAFLHANRVALLGTHTHHRCCSPRPPPHTRTMRTLSSPNGAPARPATAPRPPAPRRAASSARGPRPLAAVGEDWSKPSEKYSGFKYDFANSVSSLCGWFPSFFFFD